MTPIPLPRLALCAGLLLSFAQAALPQTATIREEARTLKTYPFSEPNPVPIFVHDSRLYPYHRFEGYSHAGAPQSWNVVTLENPHLQVFVLPQVGGKVWGAIERSSGEEFIYRNEVMKFRNIALRGPWTSGGIEFNFGIIGHTPATATPVDYRLITDRDGSVSCVVGSMDLASRTHWRVRIRLPKDKAAFETEALWYNPTPMSHPYYNWMTGAAFARDDLAFFTPGNKYLRHSGEAKSWPQDDAGRKLNLYRSNNFDSHKSYHVVGAMDDFFGGYFENAGYGFGHWSPHDDMPGQKLWLWALSRAGGIWEDLLSDTDGQYIEFQAGRLFVQYSAGDHVNPISEAGFEPYAVDKWREVWFPVKGIGGLSDASSQGVLHVEERGGQLHVGLNAFAKTRGAIEIEEDGAVVHRRPFAVDPMQVLSDSFAVAQGRNATVRVPALDLEYRLDVRHRDIERPFHTDSLAMRGIPDADKQFARGRQLVLARRFREAREQFSGLLEFWPYHPRASVAAAELEYRSARYEAGLAHANRALQIDTYDPGANYIAGVLYRAAGDLRNARESLGWAARSMTYRASATAQLGEIALQAGQFADARALATRALEYDRHSVMALQALAIAARRMGQPAAANVVLNRLLDLDPLHHFVFFERMLTSREKPAESQVSRWVRGEYPDQTWLEHAIGYHNRGLKDDAIRLLQAGSDHVDNPLLSVWLAWLQRDAAGGTFTSLLDAVERRSPAFVFPYRQETIEPLAWAAAQRSHWKWRYYLALNLWALDRREEASELLQSIREDVRFAPFYIFRAHAQADQNAGAVVRDLTRAVQVDSSDWLTWSYLGRHLQRAGEWEQALRTSASAYGRFHDNFNIGILHARSLIYNGQPDSAIAVLEKTRVLPSEMARDGRTLFEWAHLQAALLRASRGEYEKAIEHANRSREWPEHLGQGKPYDPDERRQDYLVAFCQAKLGNAAAAAAHRRAVIDASEGAAGPRSMLDFLAHRAMLEEGREAEAQRLGRRLAQSADPGARWAIATANGDRAAAERLLVEHPELASSIDFQIFRDLVLLD